MTWLAALLMASASSEPPADLDRVLSARHMTETCETLEHTYGIAQLAEAANSMSQPPWAPMRAAHCVGEAAERGGASHIRAWLDDASVPGLAAAAVAGLEQSPGPAGLEAAIAQRLHDPRFAAATRLERSRHPTLAQLVDRRQEKNSD